MKKINIKIAIVFIAIFFTACNSIDELYKIKNDIVNKDHKFLPLTQYTKAELSSQPLVTYLLDPRDSVSIIYFNNIRKVCDYTKIPFNFKYTSEWNRDPRVINTTKVLIIQNSNSIQIKAIDSLVKFVAKGGTIFLPQTTEDKRFGYLLGIKPRANFNVDVNAEGIFFDKDIIPGTTGTTIRKNQKHFGLLAENFSENVNVLAWSDSKKKYPFFIENKIGLGKVVYFNTTNLFEKADRGLFFSAILSGLQGIPYPVANTSSIFLDDFPSPLYEQKRDPIKSEMNLNMSDFVYKIWWADMKKMAAQYNLKYTALLTFDYSSNTSPPFTFTQWDSSKRIINGKNEIVADWLVNDLAKNGHEKAMHGYNHISLTETEWKNPEHILTSFKTVQKKWEINSYGELPTSFVPTSNVIDAYGLKNLHLALPSLKYMCSLYLGDTKDGGNREFDFDTYSQYFFDYPRISSGFDINDDNNYEIQSMYLYTGIWTHFVHPDDVYQTQENNHEHHANVYDLRNTNSLGWRKSKKSKNSLYSSFDKYLTKQKKLYPFAQFKTVNNAAPIVKKWRSSIFEHTEKDNTYTVEKKDSVPSKKPESVSWFVYFDKNNVSSVVDQIKSQSKLYTSSSLLNGRFYSIVSKTNKLTFNYNNPIIENEKLKEIETQYLAYKKEQYLYLTGAFNPKWEDYDLKLKKEKEMLLSRMLSEPEIDYEVWDKYAFYASWEDLGNKVWDMLEKHCKKYPSKHNILYCNNLEKILGYPSDEVHAKWITLQYKINPNYLPIVKEYLSVIISGNNKPEIEKVYKKIYELEPNKKNHQEYLYYILTNNKEEALKQLETIKPSGEFEENLIADITWFYASRNEFQKALDWSAYSEKIAFSSKLSWMYQMGQYTQLVKAYQEYIQKNPNDNEAKSAMADIYHAIGQFKEAWLLSSSLPEDDKNKKRQKEYLNKDVIYVEESLQDNLLAEAPQFFTPEAKAFILDNRRKNYGDFIETISRYSSFQSETISFSNQLNFSHYDRNKNLHTFSTSQKSMYPIVNIDFIENLLDDDNIFQTLYGFQYQFKRKANKSWNNFTYYGQVGAEFNLESKSYYNIEVGAETTNEKTSTAINIIYEPVNTSAAYLKNIYDLKLRLVYNTSINKLALESFVDGDYFNSQNVFSFFVNTKLKFKLQKEYWFKSTPVIELAMTKSSLKQDLFYPFFLTKQQIYGGLGYGIYLGREKDKFKLNNEGLYFIDTNSDKFFNIRGNIEYNFLKYTYLKGSYDFFFQNIYQSSSAQLGIKYIF